MLDVANINLHYGAAQALRGVSLQGRAGQGHLRARPQRRRQDEPAARHRRPARRSRAGAITFEGKDITPPVDRRARPARHRHRAAGPRDLPAAHRRGEPRDRLCAAAAQRAQRARRRVLAVSRCSSSMLKRRGGDLSGGQQQQLAIGRALVMRPRLLAARRADRGHPALDHQGHRPRHLLPALARADGDRAGRAVSRFRAGARRPAGGDGSRRRSSMPATRPTWTRRALKRAMAI